MEKNKSIEEMNTISLKLAQNTLALKKNEEKKIFLDVEMQKAQDKKKDLERENMKLRRKLKSLQRNRIKEKKHESCEE